MPVEATLRAAAAAVQVARGPTPPPLRRVRGATLRRYADHICHACMRCATMRDPPTPLPAVLLRLPWFTQHAVGGPAGWEAVQ